VDVEILRFRGGKVESPGATGEAEAISDMGSYSPPMKWCFSLQQENDIYVSRWWQLKYCENFHPGSLGK